MDLLRIDEILGRADSFADSVYRRGIVLSATVVRIDINVTEILDISTFLLDIADVFLRVLVDVVIIHVIVCSREQACPGEQ